MNIYHEYADQIVVDAFEVELGIRTRFVVSIRKTERYGDKEETLFECLLPVKSSKSEAIRLAIAKFDGFCEKQAALEE